MILLKFLRWLIKIDGFNHVVILPFYLFIHMNDLSLVNLMTVVSKLTKTQSKSWTTATLLKPKNPRAALQTGIQDGNGMEADNHKHKKGSFNPNTTSNFYTWVL